MDTAVTAERAAAAILLGIAGLHATWAAGSSWPAADRDALVSPGSTSPRLRRLDRRYYSPLCLTLAVAAASSARA